MRHQPAIEALRNKTVSPTRNLITGAICLGRGMRSSRTKIAMAFAAEPPSSARTIHSCAEMLGKIDSETAHKVSGAKGRRRLAAADASGPALAITTFDTETEALTRANGTVLPGEVKISGNGQGKSLHGFNERFGFPKAWIAL